MDFLFFNAANQPLFTRNDAEQAEWTVEQFSFFGLFPFDSDKVIERGQRVAFQDAGGIWKPFARHFLNHPFGCGGKANCGWCSPASMTLSG